jgi:hypothetical protein
MALKFWEDEREGGLGISWSGTFPGEWQRVLAKVKRLPGVKFIPLDKYWFVPEDAISEWRKLRDELIEYDLKGIDQREDEASAIFVLTQSLTPIPPGLILFKELYPEVSDSQLAKVLWDSANRANALSEKVWVLEDRIRKLQERIDAKDEVRSLAPRTIAEIDLSGIIRLAVPGVYFLRVPSSNLIKIGKSDSSVLVRWLYWCSVWEEDLKILGIIQTEAGEALRLEKQIHTNFAKYRLDQTEIFYPSDEILDFIEHNTTFRDGLSGE